MDELFCEVCREYFDAVRVDIGGTIVLESTDPAAAACIAEGHEWSGPASERPL